MSGTVTTGSVPDIVHRMKSVIPTGWFPTQTVSGQKATPVLDAILTGIAYGWSWLYGLIGYVRLQTRIATATDVWLDAIAQDYFGSMLVRFSAEGDAAFRTRIQANLLTPKNTRAAMINALTQLTGKAPTIFEPANTGDTGGYGGGYAPVYSGMAYGQAGAYGSLALPFQAFITAHLSSGNTGVASVAGYYNPSVGGPGLGGYGVGAIDYVGQQQIGSIISDAAIYATIEATQPAGSIMWTAIIP